MPLTLTEDAFGDAKNAAFLAALSQYAYMPQDKGGPLIESELGLKGKLISVDNTQAYVAQNDNHVVVAFRGSESPASVDGLKDWLLTNAMNLLVEPTGPLAVEFVAAGVGTRWHQGFVNAITEIWDPLFAEVSAVQKEKERCFWITGHSLGGALAQLACWLFFRKTMMPHQVYTFGAPMVGNSQVAEAFNREFSGKLFRYVNSPDPVPLLPMMSLATNDFVHADKLMLLGPSEQAANLIDYIRTAAGGILEGIMAGEIQEKVWDAIKSKVTAHLLGDYRNLLG